MAVEAEKRGDRRAAHVVRNVGAGAAIIGVLGPESWIVPGIAAFGAGWGYEALTDPKRKNKMENKMNSGEVTVFQRVGEIFLGKPRPEVRTRNQYELAG